MYNLFRGAIITAENIPIEPGLVIQVRKMNSLKANFPRKVLFNNKNNNYEKNKLSTYNPIYSICIFWTIKRFNFNKKNVG